MANTSFNPLISSPFPESISKAFVKYLTEYRRRITEFFSSCKENYASIKEEDKSLKNHGVLNLANVALIA